MDPTTISIRLIMRMSLNSTRTFEAVNDTTISMPNPMASAE